ncbi:hypothetical protein OPT61_g4850 [Boeremia exigua]|uniref:Uncharacterized protein n=1 Tax=Boeremia exigua TaxID=749465 RepID=A0ACC2ICI6_9PLEO|nr:hypothetical protein OPT61_g4850 [Boeremia exigua]
MASYRRKLDRSTLFIDDGEIDTTHRVFAATTTLQAPPASDTVSLAAPVKDQTDQAAEKNSERDGVSSSIDQNTHNQQAMSYIPLIVGSPWNEYKSVHRRKLCGSTAFVVVKLPARRKDYLILMLSSTEVEIRAFCTRQLAHENLCTMYEVFNDGGELYGVTDSMSITLRHVGRCPRYPSEEQLVAVTKQMLAGVRYLTSLGLAHRRLSIDDVFVKSDGVVKIASLEHCKDDGGCAIKNAQAVGRITMLLMDKLAHERTGIDTTRLDRWSAEAVGFLTAASTSTPDELLQHDLMQQAWTFTELRLYVSLVQMTAEMD